MGAISSVLGGVKFGAKLCHDRLSMFPVRVAECGVIGGALAVDGRLVHLAAFATVRSS